MFKKMSRQEFALLRKKSSRVVYFEEFPSDIITPITSAFSIEKAYGKTTLLESGEKNLEMGRYSFIGIEKNASISAIKDQVTIDIKGQKTIKKADPIDEARRLLGENASVSLLECNNDNANENDIDRAKYSSIFGFIGGLVGYLSYDGVRYFENIPDKHAQEIPDLYLEFYDSGLVFDHNRKVFSIVCITDDYEKGCNFVKKIYSLLQDFTVIEKSKSGDLENSTNKKSKENRSLTVTEDMTDEEYACVVEKAKEYILNGDCFQIVPSRVFSMEYSAKPLKIYRALRLLSTAPYMFYINTEEFSLVGASPEKLVSLRGKELETVPLAGTRPRGVGALDKELEDDLLNDPKEIAEHMMLVDLGRNDLGKISIPNSVRVDRLKTIEKFSKVMHIASFVKGEIGDNLDAFDAIKAVFPAGTLSGAPKIRAMEIIDELEKSKRSAYGGAIIMIDRKGDLESCIAIRMVILKSGIAKVRAGAGVVFDSDPMKEAKETKQKAEIVLDAIKLAEEGSL